MDTDLDDEETSPKTVKSEKRDKSEREYDIIFGSLSTSVLTFAAERERIELVYIAGKFLLAMTLEQ